MTLGGHPPYPAVNSETPPPVDLLYTDVLQVKLSFLRRFASLVYKSVESLMSSRARYKRYFDEGLQKLVTPKLEQHVFFDYVPHQKNMTNRLDKTSAPYDAQAKLTPNFFRNSSDLFS